MIRASSRFLLHLTAATLAGLTVLAGLVAWRLAAGPVTIDFLTPAIERVLNDNARGVRIEIADTQLTWGGRLRPLRIVAQQVRAFGRDAAPIASIPELAISFDLPSLLRGRIAPRRFELIGPRLRVLRTAEGDFAFDIEAPAATPAPEAGAPPGEGNDRPPGEGNDRPPGEGN